jgi:hypothetical protein
LTPSILPILRPRIPHTDPTWKVLKPGVQDNLFSSESSSSISIFSLSFSPVPISRSPKAHANKMANVIREAKNEQRNRKTMYRDGRGGKPDWIATASPKLHRARARNQCHPDETTSSRSQVQQPYLRNIYTPPQDIPSAINVVYTPPPPQQQPNISYSPISMKSIRQSYPVQPSAQPLMNISPFYTMSNRPSQSQYYTPHPIQAPEQVPAQPRVIVPDWNARELAIVLSSKAKQTLKSSIYSRCVSPYTEVYRIFHHCLFYPPIFRSPPIPLCQSDQSYRRILH